MQPVRDPDPEDGGPPPAKRPCRSVASYRPRRSFPVRQRRRGLGRRGGGGSPRSATLFCVRGLRMHAGRTISRPHSHLRQRRRPWRHPTCSGVLQADLHQTILRLVADRNGSVGRTPASDCDFSQFELN